MLSLRVRPAIWCSAIGGILLHACLSTGPMLAAPPNDVLLLPDVPLPTEHPPEDDPAARRAISRLLQGGREVAGPATAEVKLPEELKELLRGTPSILDGSVLDPKRPTQPRRPHRLPHAAAEASSPRRNHRAAEMLLKSARLLDKIEPKSENRTYLIHQMRSEAVRLLQQSAVPHEGSGTLPPGETSLPPSDSPHPPLLD
ncbi:hypothetical protein Mal15_14900 [Stieleria maiorica]|uniref:Uncharacterized protein n=1 Tax=Stieleria maiorica TaxID=2795974 RepID=A0A5B9MBJ3_9BACT|nr:hypothetical protein [Stieleria maiorica]QEF97450.1 hypothetical protein Mal15_14900 [Stieleria maiorica]